MMVSFLSLISTFSSWHDQDCFLKLCSEVILKTKILWRNQSTEKELETLERRNRTNAIFYCLMRICVNKNVTVLAHDCLKFDRKICMVCFFLVLVYFDQSYIFRVD